MPGLVPHPTPVPDVTDPHVLAVCQDLALMDGVRFLMIVGVLLVIALLLIELHVYNGEAAKKGSIRARTQASDTGVCPIHKGDPDTCREAHQDSSSPQPPTDDEG